MKKKFLLLIYLLCFTLTPCVFSAQKNTGVNKILYFNLPFFEKFSDECLIENLQKVYDNNHDIKAVSIKVREAQRLVKISLANELPSIGFDGFIGHSFSSSDQRFGPMTIRSYTQTRFLLPLTMNYEVDIWGKNHLKTKSYKKQLEMMQQDERAVYIALSTAVAVDYYNLIKADRLIELQKEIIDTQTKIYNSIVRKYELGTASEIDVLKAKKALTYVKEDYNNLLEKQDVLQNQLNVLLANRAFERVSRINYKDINFNSFVPEKIDVDMIESRPDWVKSQIDLERIGINVKVAKREFLPTFTVVGNLGFNMYNLSSAHKFLADIAVMPTLDLFMGGRKIQFLKLQKDEYEIALQNYNKVILQSLQETNDALYSLKSNETNYQIAKERFDIDDKELLLVNYKSEFGVADNLDVLYKKLEYLFSQKELASSNINRIISTINLYQALGGVDFIKAFNKNEKL